MKKFFSTFFTGACIALLFSACNKQEKDIDPSSRLINFTAQSIETRTAFGTPDGKSYPTLWTANDTQVKVACNYAGAKDADVTPSADFKTAKFVAEITPKEADSYKFMALSPSTAYVNLSGASYYSWNVNIPTAQTPIAGSVDEAAQILSAVSESFTELPESVNFHFTHVTAYGHFSIKNLNLSGAAVQSVSITSSVPFAGRWYYYLEDGDATAGSVQANSASSTITLTTTSLDDLWFACAPVDLSKATFKITVTTDKGSFEKTVTCPDSANLSCGSIFKFAVDFTGVVMEEPKAYILVTEASALTPDSEVIIVNTGDQKAMSTTQNTNNRGLAAVTVSDSDVSG